MIDQKVNFISIVRKHKHITIPAKPFSYLKIGKEYLVTLEPFVKGMKEPIKEKEKFEDPKLSSIEALEEEIKNADVKLSDLEIPELPEIDIVTDDDFLDKELEKEITKKAPFPEVAIKKNTQAVQEINQPPKEPSGKSHFSEPETQNNSINSLREVLRRAFKK